MIDIDKVIILENEEEYLVLDKVNYENIEYYYIAKLNESRTDIENNYNKAPEDSPTVCADFACNLQP